MGLFRRSKPIHQRLAEQGGLVEKRPGPLFTGMIREAGIHGIPRERQWDAVVTVDAPDAQGPAASFVGLADGTLLVEEGDGDLTELATAIERELTAPYRASAVRRGETQWAVAGRKIELASFTAEGEEIELTAHDGARTLAVDGRHAFGSVPQLEEIGGRQGGSYVVRAHRLDGDTWEIRVDRL